MRFCPLARFGVTARMMSYAMLGLRSFVRTQLICVSHYHLTSYCNGKALQWYRSVPEMALYDLIYLALSHLRQGEIYD